MLFRTVYGPELEAIYNYINRQEKPISQEKLAKAFVPPDKPTQNLEDALTFLQSAYLVRLTEQGWQVSLTLPDSFRVMLLRQLRQLALGELEPRHAIDPLYLSLFDELFVLPNKLFVTELHQTANQCRAVAELGGLSKEKLRAWARVMAYLGLGNRLTNQFQGVYEPSLLQEILAGWSSEGTLQALIESHLTQVLPCLTRTGNLADAVAIPLQYLEQQGNVELIYRHDSPAKPYLGERKAKYIIQKTKESDHENR